MGPTTAGTISRTKSASLPEVSINRTSPPISVSTLRAAIEIDEPRTDRISVVSVVIRLSTSPVMIRSK